MTVKTVLLSAALLLFPSLGLGYGTTGHARQQLRLIAIQLIEPRLTPTAMQLNLPAWPVALVEGDQPRLQAQLDVLVEEGVLSRETTVSTERILTEDGWSTRQTAVHHYDRPLMIRNSPVRFGRAQLLNTGEIWLHDSANADTEAEVHFQWFADDLAEWVWAPAFDKDARLQRLKASGQQPLSGIATLVWREQRWQLTRLNTYPN